MPANAFNRKTIRHLIGDGLRAKLVGTGLPCALVLDHYQNLNEWQGQAPTLMVATVSSDRQALYLGPGSLKSTFHFNLIWIVADQDLSASPPYTSAMSDDTLDDIEKLVSDWIADNRRNSSWQSLAVVQPTVAEDFVIGKAYKQESLVIQVTVPSNG